jgi:hypothetical protein
VSGLVRATSVPTGLRDSRKPKALPNNHIGSRSLEIDRLDPNRFRAVHILVLQDPTPFYTWCMPHLSFAVCRMPYGVWRWWVGERLYADIWLISLEWLLSIIMDYDLFHHCELGME